MELTRMVCMCFLVLSLLTRPASAAQKFETTKQAELDQQGNVYVSSGEGKLIRVTDTQHCLEVIFAPDKQTVGCMVKLSSEPGEGMQSRKLEIYLKGGLRRTIEPGGWIGEWHFWKDGQQVSVSSGSFAGPASYLLYDVASDRVVERAVEPADDALLPQWAKNSLQIEIESVPMSPALTEERTKWIAKILWQAGKIKPGMRRKDLLKLFTTEGGLSNRLHRTYVLIECRYIKVNVGFLPASNERDGLKEDPEDIIDSISQPYLAWSVMD